MDIPNHAKSNDSERARLIKNHSSNNFASNSPKLTSYYGSTPTNLRIPNVNSISDLNEVEQAFNSYNSNYDDSIELPRRLSQFAHNIQKRSKNSIIESNSPVPSTSRHMGTNSEKSHNLDRISQLTQSHPTTSTKSARPMNNLISSIQTNYLNNNSFDGDTISLYHFMREQKKNIKAQIYESLDYEINENTLYMVDKKKNLRYKQKGNRFLKYIRSYFPNEREFARWFIIFIIGVFTALTACFIVVNVDYFTDIKYTYIRDQFDLYLSKNHVLNSIRIHNNFTQSSIINDTTNTDETDNSLLTTKLFKLQIPLFFWFLFNAFPTALGSALVTYLAPVAAGSGIPVIKCYLNGVKVPAVVRIKTYFAKLFGVILVVCGGLCSGKEGPMIHCASVIVAGFSQGKSTTFKKDLGVFRAFREDHEKRDFVSSGAAVGGVLFSLEEGASFWNQILTWRIFFCSLISTFTLNFIMSVIHNKIGLMPFSGLINFGKFDSLNYTVLEIPIFIFLGCAGGLIGAAFNEINHKLTVFRMKYLSNRLIKVLEAVFVALLTAFAGFVLIIISSECKPFDSLEKDNKFKYPLRYNCKENEFSTMASLFMSNAEAVVINMFHVDGNLYSIGTLSIFFFVYFFLSVITYGLSISSGIFIPALLIGSVFGRIVALCSVGLLSSWTSQKLDINELSMKYALIGAASVLGGVVRMTLSLTVILIETTGNLTLGLPLMICLIFAKWVGDSCNEGLYDIHIKLQQIPFLHDEPSMNNKEIDEDEIIFVQQIMSTPVVTLNRIETVRNIVMILQNETHYGFPIVDSTSCFNRDGKNHDSNTNLNFSIDERTGPIDELSADYANSNQLKDDLATCSNDNYMNKMKIKRALGNYGKLRGFVLRWQLIVLLQKKNFNQYLESSQVNISSDIFRDAYPRYDNIDKVIDKLNSAELDYKIDLSYVMNPSPYSVPYNCSFDRTYRLFRALGLRHLCVTDDSNNVVGIISRKDMTHFKVISHKGKRYIQRYSESIMQ